MSSVPMRVKSCWITVPGRAPERGTGVPGCCVASHPQQAQLHIRRCPREPCVIRLLLPSPNPSSLFCKSHAACEIPSAPSQIAMLFRTRGLWQHGHPCPCPSVEVGSSGLLTGHRPTASLGREKGPQHRGGAGPSAALPSLHLACYSDAPLSLRQVRNERSGCGCNQRAALPLLSRFLSK